MGSGLNTSIVGGRTTDVRGEYARRVLENELYLLSGATNGGRNVQLNKTSFNLGQLVGAGALPEEQTAELLEQAALAIGETPTKARSTIRRGMRKGMQNPRDLSHLEGRGVRGGAPRLPAPAPVMREPEPIKYPDHGEVQSLWDRCVPVVDDEEVAAYLMGRCIDPEAVALWDLARAIPQGLELPAWAWCGESWTGLGNRLLVPAFDGEGVLRTFKARAVVDGVQRKELSPRNAETKGVAFACPLAIQVLRGQTPDWWERPSFAVMEGSIDFLTMASRQSEGNEQGWAYLGVFQGSHPIAASIPEGAQVAFFQHDDDGGEGIASRFLASTPASCERRSVTVAELGGRDG